MKHKIKKQKFQVRAHFQCERKIAVNSSTESVKPSDTSTFNTHAHIQTTISHVLDCMQKS